MVAHTSRNTVTMSVTQRLRSESEFQLRLYFPKKVFDKLRGDPTAKRLDVKWNGVSLHVRRSSDSEHNLIHPPSADEKKKKYSYSAAPAKVGMLVPCSVANFSCDVEYQNGGTVMVVTPPAKVRSVLGVYAANSALIPDAEYYTTAAAPERPKLSDYDGGLCARVSVQTYKKKRVGQARPVHVGRLTIYPGERALEFLGKNLRQDKTQLVVEMYEGILRVVNREPKKGEAHGKVGTDSSTNARPRIRVSTRAVFGRGFAPRRVVDCVMELGFDTDSHSRMVCITLPPGWLSMKNGAVGSVHKKLLVPPIRKQPAPNQTYKYDSPQKASYREKVWDLLLRDNFYSIGTRVMILPHIAGHEVEVLRKRKVIDRDILLVDKEPSRVAHAKRRTNAVDATAMISKISEAAGRIIKSGWPVSAVNLDFNSNINPEMCGEMEVFLKSEALMDHCRVAVTYLKGREPDSAFSILDYAVDYAKVKRSDIIRGLVERCGWIVTHMRVGTYQNGASPMEWVVFDLVRGDEIPQGWVKSRFKFIALSMANKILHQYRPSPNDRTTPT